MVGTFPDGNSALMLVCARLRHVAGTQWGNKKYMNMKHLEEVMDDASKCFMLVFFYTLFNLHRLLYLIAGEAELSEFSRSHG